MGHRQLNREKREIIERLLEQQHSVRSIARILGYSPSAISQEIVRNREYVDGRLAYHHTIAQRKTDHRRKRFGQTSKPCETVSYVVDKLQQYWSPEQIEGRLKLKFPQQPRSWISFKTIYRWIERSKQYRSPLGLRAKYTKYLRLKRAGKQLRPDGNDTRGRRRDLPSIENRPREIARKNQFGHWEGDLVLGFRGKKNVATLVEMSTGLLLVARCKDKQKKTVTSSILEAFRDVDNDYVKTITLDRGSEFSGYEKLEEHLDCNVYFCHPQAPNERALNEQTNGLLRQFYPKRKRSVFTDPDRLRWAVNLINNRPRKKFGYRTTWEVIEERGLAEVFSLV